METGDINKSGPQDWIPITDKLQLAVLGKLGEELCEGGSAIFRSIIQGLNSKEPKTSKINRHWIEDEIADIRAMLDHAEHYLDLDTDTINQRQKAKYDFKAPWFAKLFRGEI